MTSSVRPEIHNISECRQSRTKRRSWVKSEKKHLVKSGRVVPEICSRTDRQTDTQTDRHTDRYTHHNTPFRYLGRSNKAVENSRQVIGHLDLRPHTHKLTSRLLYPTTKVPCKLHHTIHNKVSLRRRRDDMPPGPLPSADGSSTVEKPRRIYVRPRTGPESAQLWCPAVATLQAASEPIA